MKNGEVLSNSQDILNILNASELFVIYDITNSREIFEAKELKIGRIYMTLSKNILRDGVDMTSKDCLDSECIFAFDLRYVSDSYFASLVNSGRYNKYCKLAPFHFFNFVSHNGRICAHFWDFQDNYDQIDNLAIIDLDSLESEFGQYLAIIGEEKYRMFQKMKALYPARVELQRRGVLK